MIWAKVGATWEKQDARQNPKGGHVEGNLSPPGFIIVVMQATKKAKKIICIEMIQQTNT